MSLIARIAARMVGAKKSAPRAEYRKPAVRTERRPSLAEVALDEAAIPAPVELPTAPPPPIQVTPGFRGRCKAPDADSGRECQLLEGHAGHHRSVRGPFWRVLEQGQQSTRTRIVDTFAAARRTTQGETP